MTTERPVGLNTGVPQGMGEYARSAQDGRREASDQDRRAFDDAMSGNREHPAGQSGEPAELARKPAGPFGLLGNRAGSPEYAGSSMAQQDGEAARAAARALSSRVASDLFDAAGRLMVADGRDGRRAVRIELKDEVLPGVAVSIFEQEGRIVAAFTCGTEASCERMCAAAQHLADELAASLARSTLVQVSTDDPDDPCLREAIGDPA